MKFSLFKLFKKKAKPTYPKIIYFPKTKKVDFCEEKDDFQIIFEKICQLTEQLNYSKK